MPEIYTYIVDMPVDEAVRPCGPFSYTVYINAHLSHEKRRQVYKHALEHIQRGDFEKRDVNINTIEKEAHNGIF